MIDRDFAIGDAGEIKVTNLIKSTGLTAKRNTDEEKRYFYDICVTGKLQFTVEVKHDVYALKSGNLAIEVHNSLRNQPSGINITQADIWAHVFDGVYITPVSSLKSFINKTTPLRIVSYAGDCNATLYLYTIGSISSIFTRIDNLSGDQLITTLQKMLNGV